LVAFDGEFVSVALEQADTNADGQKVLVQESRQNLARYSLVDGGVVEEQAPLASAARDKDGKLRIVADDYIIPSETIVDYLTRFSGLVAEDLQPAVSRNAVVPNRTAYLKLRFFADNGCIFVGHGLDKDFETANIFVPRDQIIDTVELWRLPNQRKLALRFLAAYVLKEDIQDEIHDSIEDAKTALLLYRTYQGVAAQGFNHLQTVLQEMYTYGTKSNWSIRQDLIEEHFASAASASIDVVKV
jgi:PAB-dependent poly(A)-specific ribonuclease subunit 2